MPFRSGRVGHRGAEPIPRGVGHAAVEAGAHLGAGLDTGLLGEALLEGAQGQAGGHHARLALAKDLEEVLVGHGIRFHQAVVDASRLKDGIIRGKIDGQWMKGPLIFNHEGHWNTEAMLLTSV